MFIPSEPQFGVGRGGGFMLGEGWVVGGLWRYLGPILEFSVELDRSWGGGDGEGGFGEERA